MAVKKDSQKGVEQPIRRKEFPIQPTPPRSGRRQLPLELKHPHSFCVTPHSQATHFNALLPQVSG
ncbi:MAG: hypothetical protein A3J28_13800 [Acidobacteria bacterium RIFCSPLOWO2_12_FULL_60_22]|nr:MAG: hypothetical protein A3J28_13800 [Acidobacteria bacterium RIFCSPLOWO2_12_FULL_60_22]